MKRVAILVDSLEAGGVQKAALKEAIYMRQNGVATDLVVIRRLPSNSYHSDLKNLCTNFMSDNSRLLRWSFRFPFFHYFSTHHLTGALLSPRMLSTQYSLIISHGSTTSIAAYWLKRTCNIPYFAFIWDPMTYILHKVYSQSNLVHFLGPLRRIALPIEGKIVENASLVLTCSSVHSSALSREYGVNSTIVYPGTVIPKEPIQKIGDEMLAFTRWELAKNPAMLLQILVRIPQARLFMAGKWASQVESEVFLSMAKKFGVVNRLEHIGYFTDNDITRICERGRLWVHPNFEAFGMGGLEAASNGVPIIIPKGSGVSEIFQDGREGFFPTVGDLDSYSEGVSKLISDPELAFRMGRAARSTAERYTWDAHSSSILKLAGSFT